MEQAAPRLIILRGNSASGKSTLAVAIQRALGPYTANIGQDHFRRVVLREHERACGDNIYFIANAVQYCLAMGYDVILEGMLRSAHYGAMLRELVQSYPGQSLVFYLEIALDESLRRHDGRPLRAEVPPQKLHDWFVPSDVLGIPEEIVMDGSGTMQATLAALLAIVGQRRTDGADGRFL